MDAASPVIAYANAMQLPLDVIVQPESEPQDVSIALGHEAGRCNLGAEAILAGVNPSQHNILIEIMAAHELGHCWHYVQGKWNSLPAGFSEFHDYPGSTRTAEEQRRAKEEARREEGFADLVGLVWAEHHHAENYQQIYKSLQAHRSAQSLAGRLFGAISLRQPAPCPSPVPATG